MSRMDNLLPTVTDPVVRLDALVDLISAELGHTFHSKATVDRLEHTLMTLIEARNFALAFRHDRERLLT